MKKPFLVACVMGLLLVAALPAGARTDDRPSDAEPQAIEEAERQDDGGGESVEGAAANSFEQAVQLIEPSVVYLGLTVTGWVNDGEDWLGPYEVTSHCSGTIIDSTGYILSAGHCVDPEEFRVNFIEAAVAEWIENGWNINEDGSVAFTEEELFEAAFTNWTVEGEDPNSSADVEVVAELASSVAGLANNRVLGARVVDFQPLDEGDVALLKVEQTNLPATPVATTDPDVGADIVSVGFPATVDLVSDPDLNAAYKDGRISQQRTRDGGTLPVWEISAAMSGGMSGGPTANMDGEVVGVNSYSINGEEQQFNFISPAQLVREIASRNGVSLEIDEVSQAYREGVRTLHAEEYQAAVDSFDKVLETVPSHSKASELRQIAANSVSDAPTPEAGADQSSEGEPETLRADAAADDGGGNGWIWGLGAAVLTLLVIVGVLGVMVTRQRRPN